MKNLLIFEFRKLLRRKTTYIFIGVQVLYLVLSAVIQYVAWQLSGDFADLLGLSTTAVGYMMSASRASTTTILLGIFVAMVGCEERNNDTLKNIISRGYDPTRVLFAEYIALCAFSVAFTLAGILFGFISGAIFFDMGTFTGLNFAMLVIQFVTVIAYMSLFFMFSKVIKKFGGVMAINLCLPIGVSLVFMLLDFAFYKTDFKISAYTIDGILGTLSGGSPEGWQVAVAFVLSLVYAASFTAIAYASNRKSSA